MLAGGYYSSGKGFQKVAMVCLLLEKFLSVHDNLTQECVGWLASCFECFHSPAAHGSRCLNAPSSYYNKDWGGLVERSGWDKADCVHDFGNSCYNDHHYHFGYFVVSGAVLAKLNPDILRNDNFVSYINLLVRNTANPNAEDKYFPQFRTFDWFDLHSWSHGIVPSHDGKDQESTSEELNLLYGVYLWGKVTSNSALEHLGATMLALAAHTVREIFLMQSGNNFHPSDFVKNHVTGIFLQGKVDYTTWFGRRPEYIHGIQMLPLSPALALTRKAEFCQQEWDDILSKIDFQTISKAWASVLLTGNLAVISPDCAYRKLQNIQERDFDAGLSRAWALYWAASRSHVARFVDATSQASTNVTPRSSSSDMASSILMLLDNGKPPDESIFPSRNAHPVHPPENSRVAGPKATNKFWSNWLVEAGSAYPVFPMPYALKFNEQGELQVSQCSKHIEIYSKSEPDRILTYLTGIFEDIRIGAIELPRKRNFAVLGEGLLGAEVEVKGTGDASVVFPVYSGMAYISGRYSGGLTPEVSHHHGIKRLEKVAAGIWSFHNKQQVEYRVYVLNATGDFVDDGCNFNSKGQLSRQLDGWLRVARVLEPSDRWILDAHARAVLTGMELEVDSKGAVQYRFKTAFSNGVSTLHWAFGHHLQLMV
eukprot:TRINITY_DN27258_c0_g1_i2.p1 TRINITY_DN27258_c0_g1~~TRINITY_DN27258_c0_g1_i2.p1  ORF type:complete len:651 (+),score=93.78 TRINITY_DN27258_c0_g1_i2:348-2300(+)